LLGKYWRGAGGIGDDGVCAGGLVIFEIPKAEGSGGESGADSTAKIHGPGKWIETRGGTALAERGGEADFSGEGIEAHWEEFRSREDEGRGLD